MRSVLSLVLVVASCAHPATRATSSNLSSAAAVAVVTDYGADPDAPDNRAAIQRALDANVGGVVRLPPGTWRVGRAGSAFWCLNLPARTSLVGDGASVSTLRQVAVDPSVRLVEVDGDDSTIADLSLDGARSIQVTPSTQRHGTFVRGRRLTIARVVAHDFTGDGIYLFNGADGATLDHVTARDDARNGLTMGGLMTGVSILGGAYVHNEAQQIDSEPGTPGHVDDVTIRDALVDAQGASADYAITVCGTAGAQSRGWTIDRAVVGGGIYVVWASDVTVTRTIVANPTPKPALTVYRRAERIVVDHSQLSSPAARVGVSVVGTGLGQAPADVALLHSTISGGSVAGVSVEGATSVELADVSVVGPGFAAVSARPTSLAYDLAWLVLRQVTASGWTRGVTLAGYGSADAGYARLDQLVSVDSSLGAPSYLDDGFSPLQSAAVTGLDVARWPAGALVDVGPVETTMRRP